MSYPQTSGNESQTAQMYGPGQQPMQTWGPPPGQPAVMATPMMMPPRYGPIMTLIGNVLAAAGVIVLAFAMSTITVYRGNYTDETYTFGVGVIVVTIGVLLIGIGILVRSLGVFLAGKA